MNSFSDGDRFLTGTFTKLTTDQVPVIHVHLLPFCNLKASQFQGNDYSYVKIIFTLFINIVTNSINMKTYIYI